MLAQIWRLASAAYLLTRMLAHCAIVSHEHDVGALVMMVLCRASGSVAPALAWFAVLHQHRHGYPPRRLLLLLLARTALLLHLLLGHFVFGLPFHFVAVILEPDFHLGRGQVDHAG